MTTAREECLDTAKQLITQDRAETYGDISDVSQIVSDLLAALPLTGTPADYPLTQIVVKLARLSQNPQHYDSWTDIAGYAALGYDLAATSNREYLDELDRKCALARDDAGTGQDLRNVQIPDPTPRAMPMTGSARS